MTQPKTQPMYQQSFGTDFDLGITIPDHFEDISYKNDVSPSFRFKHSHLPNMVCKLWVDHADQEQREFEDGDRYIVELFESKDDDEYHNIGCIFSTEDPETITAFIKSIA